jgi:hypothetical protein
VELDDRGRRQRAEVVREGQLGEAVGDLRAALVDAGAQPGVEEGDALEQALDVGVGAPLLQGAGEGGVLARERGGGVAQERELAGVVFAEVHHRHCACTWK